MSQAWINPPGLIRLGKAVFSTRRHILLLSHMRAYTSLLGHIMGSNPEICGYYEMHIGYYSWKSLVRQKILFSESETFKPTCRYVFDKVLHNDHEVSINILKKKRVLPIFSLRSPERVIPSILKLYARVDPEHEFNSASFASTYYIERLENLENIASHIPGEYFYLDADALVSDSSACLKGLSEWLGLKTPLSEEYDIQAKTELPRFGDSSGNLSSGRIAKRSQVEDSSTSDTELMSEAESTYNRVRKKLIEESHRKCITT